MLKSQQVGSKVYSNTNVEEVKRLNANSGLSYTEVKALMARKYIETNRKK